MQTRDGPRRQDTRDGVDDTRQLGRTVPRTDICSAADQSALGHGLRRTFPGVLGV